MRRVFRPSHGDHYLLSNEARNWEWGLGDLIALSMVQTRIYSRLNRTYLGTFWVGKEGQS